MVYQSDDNSEQVIERLDQLIEETASRGGETESIDDIDPVARKHQDAVRRGANGDSGDRRTTEE